MTLKTLNDFFADNEELDKKLFVNNGTFYTKEVIRKIIKKYIKTAKDIKEEECVLCTQNNLLFIIAFFALLHSKKTIILASNVREKTLNMLGAKHVFTDENVSYKDVEVYNLNLSYDETYNETKIVPFDCESSKIVFFTSGSTGVPKRIYKSFNSLYLELSSIDALFAYHIKENTTTISTVNFFHLYGMTFSFLFSMANGFLIDTKLVETPEDLLYKLSIYKNCFLVTSPAFMDRLARYKENYSFKSKPYLMTSSGGPLSTEGAIASKELFGIYPYEVFGSTETGVVGNRRQIENNVWTLFPYVKAETSKEGNLVVKSHFLDQKEFVMGDGVEFLDTNNFILKGRLDRMVKIEEKRVSLPEIEEALLKHKFIEKSYCLPIINNNERKSIGACISLNAKGRNFLVFWGKRKLTEELKRYLKEFVDVVAIPTKWRFVDEIPVNTQSKVLVGEINAFFETDITEPVVFNKTKNVGNISMDLVFLDSASYFEGHFPDFALLPAVVQIHFAIYFAHRNWPEEFPETVIDIDKMSRIKFSNMIRPNNLVTLTITKTDDGLSFKYYDKSSTYSSGTIILKR